MALIVLVHILFILSTYKASEVKATIMGRSGYPGLTGVGFKISRASLVRITTLLLKPKKLAEIAMTMW